MQGNILVRHQASENPLKRINNAITMFPKISKFVPNLRHFQLCHEEKVRRLKSLKS